MCVRLQSKEPGRKEAVVREDLKGSPRIRLDKLRQEFRYPIVQSRARYVKTRNTHQRRLEYIAS